jgi:hypothetical protein
LGREYKERGIILNKMIRKGHHEKVKFEKRSEGSEELHHVDTREKSDQGRKYLDVVGST